MSDARLRELEREATDGSPAAVAALARERVRADLCPWCGDGAWGEPDHHCCCRDCASVVGECDQCEFPDHCPGCPAAGCAAKPELVPDGPKTIGKVEAPVCPLCNGEGQVLVANGEYQGHQFGREVWSEDVYDPCCCTGVHKPEAEFHYVDVSSGGQGPWCVPAALIDVRCSRCEEPIDFCSRCGGIYGMHVGGDFAVSRCGPGVVACSGIAAAWCPVHGDCVCPSDDKGNRWDLDDPDCPLHAPTSHHAASVDETDDPNRPGAR